MTWRAIHSGNLAAGDLAEPLRFRAEEKEALCFCCLKSSPE